MISYIAMGPEKLKIERVLLILPPVTNARITVNTCVIPDGIASLAAYVRDKVEVKCLDAGVEGYYHVENLGGGLTKFGLSDDEIIKRVEDFKPDLVGFSCLFSSQFPDIRRLSARVKKLDPSIITVTGGSHPSALTERCMATTTLDYIVLGEGELAFSRLIDGLRKGEGVEKIPGLAFRDNGEIRINPKPEYIADLDQLPLPARELFPVEDYFKIEAPPGLLSRSERNLTITTSRGCPFRCGFCLSTIHWGHRYRTRSAERVLDELEELKAKYEIEEIKFMDDSLTSDKERARQLFSGMITRKLNLVWNTPNAISAWTLDESLLELMKESGCYEISVAVQSGDPWVLKSLIDRPAYLEKAKEMVKFIKKLKMGTSGTFIIGMPGETREQIMKTINFARSLELDRPHFLIYTPLPGTPLAKLAMDMGRLPKDYDFENISTLFLPGFQLSEVEPDELRKIHRRAFWSMHLALPYRHPIGFFKKYCHTLYSHPDWVVEFLRGFFR